MSQIKQDYMFISGGCNKLFSVIADDQEEFNKAFKYNIKDIIKKNNVGGAYKIVNLENAAEKEYFNPQSGGGGDCTELFRTTYAEYRDYIENNQNNINNKKVAKYYKTLSNCANNIGLSKDELNKIFFIQ